MNTAPLRYRRLSAVLLASLLLVVPAAWSSDAGLAAANEVSYASYYDFMDNYLFTHVGDDRGPDGPELVPCRDNIVTLMQGYGLAVELEPFAWDGDTYHNVVGTLVGTVDPNREYIIGAHYDSVSNPGADDNASGVALVLECARVLSQYESDYTIRFVAFSMEERGLIGSEAYVSTHLYDDIRGMISADMVAYDPGTNACNVYGTSASAPIKNALADAVFEYGDGLTPIVGGDVPYSDHAPFEDEGFQACLLIEGEVWNNPYYHQQADNFENPDNLNFDYAIRMTRSVCGWLVDAAGVQVPTARLEFTYPDGLPATLTPMGGTAMRVEVSGVDGAVPVPDTGVLHYEAGGGWQTVPMTALSANEYEAVFPAQPCGTAVTYYVSAEAQGGVVYTDPKSAPGEVFEAISAHGFLTVFADDFETDLGWTVENLGASSGDWERGVPVNDPSWEYDPVSDGDGSGQCYLTQNEMGNTDVDAGATRLISPILDFRTGNITIDYAYYLHLTETGGADHLLVELSSNGVSGPWIEIARHDTHGGTAWRTHSVGQTDLDALGIALTENMQLRFTVNDADPQSIVEAGLDGIQISSLDCTAPDFCRGDFDCDGDRDYFDIEFLLAALNGEATWQDEYEAKYGVEPPCEYDLNCDADGQGDGTTYFDIQAFLTVLGTPCP